MRQRDNSDNSQSSLSMWHKGPQVLEDDDSVTIYKSERIGIPNRVMERYFEDYDGIRFYATEDRTKIALEPCDFDDPNAYKLQTGSTGSKGMVTASSFLEHIGVDFEETKELPAEWDSENGVLMISINNVDA